MNRIKNTSIVVGMLVAAASASASIIGYTPGTAAGGGIIAAPAEVLNASVYNTAQQGFDEQQGVLLAAPLSVDAGGPIPAGTLVDSHMIFLNQKNGTAGTLTDSGVVWTFSGTILGVMSDTPGNLEGASTALLGAAGTTYPAPFANRGMEGADSYVISGNQLTVKMQVTQPGDWIRVVTAASVPDSGSTALLLVPALGLVALGARRRQA